MKPKDLIIFKNDGVEIINNEKNKDTNFSVVW